MPHAAVIWHVDDNQADLDLIAIALGTEPVRLRSFLDPLDALDALVVVGAEDIPDLLLLDVNMPGLDGFQFLRLVQTEPRLDRMRVCVVSGTEFPREHPMLRLLGTASAIRKPATVADFPALRTAVLGFLGGSVPPTAKVLTASL